MKTITTLCLCASVFNLAASAAVPLRWTVETTRAQPATFEAYQGETLTFESALQSAGKPLALSGIAALYWQTNGMGSTYWETTAAVNSNRLSAVWTPEMDVGARSYNCFIGVPGTIYHAAFQLRLRPSPGATPNVLPLPVPVIDFAKVRVLNPPWESGGGGGIDTNAVAAISNRVAALETATNNLSSSVSSLVSTKADKAALDAHVANTNNPHGVTAAQVNAYTKEETDAKLDGKLNGPNDSGIVEAGAELDALTLVGRNDVTTYGDVVVRNSDDIPIHFLSLKANRADSSGEVLNGELATLDDDGNPTRSGIAKDDVATKSEILKLRKAGNTIYVEPEVETLYFGTDGTEVRFAVGTDVIVWGRSLPLIIATVENDLAPKTMISATDTTFSNEVATVARTVTPPPSPTLRLYDEVRQCYWIGRMVNGVINWEVE